MRANRHRYTVGIVGCGRAGGTLHLPALRTLRSVTVTGLADTDAARLGEVADRHGIGRTFTEPTPLIEDPDIDILAVCVPVQSHVEVTLPALKAGKHLLIEKPLALNLEGCDALIKAASTGRSNVMVGFNLRFHRLVRQARQIVASGALGEIEAITSRWTSAIRSRQPMPAWRNHREQGGGALFEIGVHHFDLWRYLLESEIDEVHAWSRSGEWPDETVSISARMRNGSLASGLFSERTSDGNDIEIFGRRGRLGVSLFRYDGLALTPISSAPGAADRVKKAVKSLFSIPTGLSVMRAGGDFRTSYRDEWNHLVDTIRKGVQPESSLNDGREAVRAVLASFESLSSGRSVVLRRTPGNA